MRTCPYHNARRWLLVMLCGFLLCSCALESTPQGIAARVGTDTGVRISAEGDAKVKIGDGVTITGDNLVVIGGENQSDSMGMIKTAYGWSQLAGSFKALVNGARGIYGASQVTAREGLRTTAATEQARIAAGVRTTEILNPPKE